ncbi:MAG TPA: glycosyltransferase family 2 protein [Gemmatimonadales bacterium]
MIYVCIPSYDEGPTIGLVLWKTRQVFGDSGREYQLLVVDDGSTDRTAETLEPYAKVLPLSVVRHDHREGYAASVETLLQLALERSDRPRRDCAVLMQADFSHLPQFVPDLVRGIDSGADLVVGEAKLEGAPSRGYRWLRRWAPALLGTKAKVPGLRDMVSGFLAVRLSCLRLALKDSGDQLLLTDGWAANAELISRLAANARRVEAVPVVERLNLRQRPSRVTPWDEAKALWGARRALRLVGATR